MKNEAKVLLKAKIVELRNKRALINAEIKRALLQLNNYNRAQISEKRMKQIRAVIAKNKEARIANQISKQVSKEVERRLETELSSSFEAAVAAQIAKIKSRISSE